MVFSPVMILSAVTGPTPLIPTTLSELSPMSAFTPGTSAGGTSDLTNIPLAGESCTMPEPLVTW